MAQPASWGPCKEKKKEEKEALMTPPTTTLRLICRSLFIQCHPWLNTIARCSSDDHFNKFIRMLEMRSSRLIEDVRTATLNTFMLTVVAL